MIKPDMAGLRVLVAEDSLLVLMGLEMLLEQSGIEIVGTASTVAEALVLAHSVTPDLAILDVNLHDQMSYPAAEVLIERGVPVIFTTGYSPGDTLPPHLAQVPAIQKPYEGQALLALIRLLSPGCVGARESE